MTGNPPDIASFWRVLSARAIGATVVTAQGVDGPAGFLGLSASHVCAHPPAMLVSVDAKTSALAAIMHSRHFAINYLAEDAADVAEAFGGKTDLKGADRFSRGSWGTLTTGAPVLEGALGVMDCAVEQTVEYHSTTIVIGRVMNFAVKDEGKPLVYFRGKLLGN